MLNFNSIQMNSIEMNSIQPAIFNDKNQNFNTDSLTSACLYSAPRCINQIGN